MIHKQQRTTPLLYLLVVFLFCFSLPSICFSKTQKNDAVYRVEFHDANIQDAVRLLAKIGNKNIVVSNKIKGSVTASFEKITINDAINAVLNSNGYGIVERNNVMQILNKEEIAAFGEDLKTTSFALNHAKASDILPHVEALVSERGSAIADRRTNTIHIRDTEVVAKNISALIYQLDRKGKQVLIEAKIIEASANFVRGLGIQWGVTQSGSNVQTAGLTSVGTADSGRSLMFNAPVSDITAATAGIGMILGSFKGTFTDIQLTAAEQQGDIEILARPSIATMNNEAATIKSGTRFYVKTSGDLSLSSTTTGSSTTGSSNLEQIETGIELKVTPQISKNNYIKLTIAATESEADFSKAIDGVPAVIDNEAETTVMLKNGETTIIGGLFRVRDAKTVKGIPGLMKIPIIGHLFKSKARSKEKSELLIFIKPKVITSAVTRLPHFNEPNSYFNPNAIPLEKNTKKKKRKRR